MKLEKATVGDIVLSIIIPGWGFLVGLIALIKREFRRAFTMIGISAVLIAIFAIWSFSTRDQPAIGAGAGNGATSIEQQLVDAAKQLTQSGPRMVDASTRLDGATAGPGLTFTYLYSMPSATVAELDLGKFDSEVAPTIQNRSCSSPDLRSFFDNNVEVLYKYRDKNGALIGTVAVNKNACGH